MKLIDDLRAEHELIERVLGSMRTYFERLVAQTAPVEDAAKFVSFFQTYAGAFHHEREEQILFPALVSQVDLPGDHGPIFVLNQDHRAMEGIIAEMKSTLDRGSLSDSDRSALRDLAVRYSHDLWHHIDAENHVFLPECEVRLRRHGVRDLESRDPGEAERTAAATGDELSLRYPPMEDRDVIRGEGCMMCPAYGDRCRGIEREWWNQWEWEELSGHLGSD